MPLPKALLDELQRRRVKESVEARRETRRDLVFTALRCMCWCLLGLLSMGMAFHSTDPVWGRALFYLGFGVGNGGILYSLLAAYRRGEKRGDW